LSGYSDYSLRPGFQYGRTALGRSRYEVDTFKIALAQSISSTKLIENMSEVVEVDYTNLVGNLDISLNYAEATSVGGFSRDDEAKYSIGFEDKVFEASGGNIGPIVAFVIYNDTLPDKPVMLYLELDGDITITDGNSLEVVFPPKDTGSFAIANVTVEHTF